MEEKKSKLKSVPAAKKKTGIEKVEGNSVVINDMEAFGEHLKAIGDRYAQRAESIQITKASIKGSLFLYVEFSEELPGHSKNDTKFDCSVPAHEDLINSFDRLRKHLAFLCDQLPVPKKDKFAGTDVEDFTVKSFSLSGDIDASGISITGSRSIKYGKLNLTSPNYKFSNEAYPFVSELAEAIEACKYEIFQYMFHGKKAPDSQIPLDFGEEDSFAEAGL